MLIQKISFNSLLNFMRMQGSLRWVGTKHQRDVPVDIKKQRMVITPILRLVFSLLSLVDTSEFFEVSLPLFSF